MPLQLLFCAPGYDVVVVTAISPINTVGDEG